jgi:hypothetical protein
MRLIILVAIIVLGAGLLVRLNQAANNIQKSRANVVPQEDENLLLPDLQISPPKDLSIQFKGGVRKIRFDTTFSNIGKGPLELIGATNDTGTKTVATQIINKTDGTVQAREVGEFVFHPGHKHWHLERYAQFQLWNFDMEGKPTQLVASTDKMSFCIWDEHPYDLKLEGAPQTRQYPRCLNDTQGNSVGWGDTYQSGLEGQEITITDIPNGKFLVRSVVNVDKKILESDYTNNEAFLFIELAGNGLRIVNGPN